MGVPGSGGRTHSKTLKKSARQNGNTTRLDLHRDCDAHQISPWARARALFVGPWVPRMKHVETGSNILSALIEEQMNYTKIL